VARVRFAGSVSWWPGFVVFSRRSVSTTGCGCLLPGAKAVMVCNVAPAALARTRRWVRRRAQPGLRITRAAGSPGAEV
jgi:hypothetical protein